MGEEKVIVNIDDGYYINIFEVRFLSDLHGIDIMVGERRLYNSLKRLREEIKDKKKDIFVYAPQGSNKIYGYGEDMNWLTHKGFFPAKINIMEIPKLTGRAILEGILNKGIQKGYFPKYSENIISNILDKMKGRIEVYKRDPTKEISRGNIKIFRGFDLRVIYLRDIIDGKIKFGLVVDTVYSLRDKNNNSLNYHDIVSRYGSNILKEIRIIQGDLISTEIINGNIRTKINPIVAKQRLNEEIIPFVKELAERRIKLPLGVEADILVKPGEIILGLGGEYEDLR